MQHPIVSNFMAVLRDPTTHLKLLQKFEELKEDPELEPIIKEMEESGPGALHR